MKFLTRNTLAVPVIVFMAAVLFDENVPSYTQARKLSSETKHILAGAASHLFQISPRPDMITLCFPRYFMSSFNGVSCNARVEIGPVIVFDTTYRVSNKQQCTYILSTKVRSALQSKFYKMCVSGLFI